MLQKTFSHAFSALYYVNLDFIRWLGSLLQPRSALAAENLFLRKKLSLYQERQVRPRRATDATRLTMVLAARLLDWKKALVSVRSETFITWHRRGFKLFPKDLRQLIRAMARDNPAWGQARIAAELLVKLGIKVSPRTVQKYVPDDAKRGRRRAVPAQRWKAFVRDHARAMLACDCFVSVSIRFQILSVFVLMEVGSRRLVHFNVTAHPTWAWTLQQFRQAIDNEQNYRFVIHDRDTIYSPELDPAVRAIGVKILKTPFRSPQANSHCERLIGSLRRDCLDFLIPIHGGHLRGILKDWKIHYCQARLHASLGPGLPEPADGLPVPLQKQRHQIPAGYRVRAKPILGGLHHEYRLEKIAA